jgi:LuxR family maltose regulon positive regulatory protein
MNVPLLTTKLFAPKLRRKLVPRPRLTGYLDMGLQRKLTLISAPAGFGKTTLAAEWLNATPHPVTWFSLDETDNDPARFLTYFVAALQKVNPTIGTSVQAMLQAPQPPPPEVLLTALLNDIAATPTPFVLVIDDYHVIQTLATHQHLVFLLEHLPSQMHIVLISREDPPFPLSRLRARGQMTDIRQADLRFTEEETRDFAQRVMPVALSPDDITTLHACTEGWVTGLQFAALSMQHHSDVHRLLQSLTADNRYILDYLMDEVFQRQPAEVQDFLLKTSVLERFSAPLCDAVTGHKESDAILPALEHANLFIVPLDEVRQWYRYHHLFADLLLHRLETRLPDQVRPLHVQAAQWFADNGFPEDAVRHALAAADWTRAAELITSGLDSDLLRRGETTTLRRWSETFPDTFLCSHPSLCLVYAWALILTEQLDTAETYLARAEHMGQATGTTTDAFLGNIAVARVHIARVRGDHSRTVELSEKALALLPEDALSERSIVALNLGITQWFAGQLDKAKAALEEAERTGRGSANTSVWIAALVFQGRILAAQGRPQDAADLCQRIVEQGGQASMAGLAHFDLARLFYEWNRLDAAADHAQNGIVLNLQRGSPEFQVGGHGILALIKQAQGDGLAVQEALDKTTQLLGEANISPPTRLYNLVIRLLIALAKGDLEAASRIAAQAPSPQEAGSFPDLLLLMLAQARLFLALGQRDKAAELIAHLHGMALSRGWRGSTIRARVLQILTAPNQEEALAILAEALTQAEPLGYIRTFLDLGEPMRLVLAAYRPQAGERKAYVDRLLGAFAVPTPPAAPSKIQNLKSAMVEPLSDREIDVLRLLVAGLTNQEIALTMHVSVNTVKTHLKNIYDKLDVHDRREAILRAKELGVEEE